MTVRNACVARGSVPADGTPTVYTVPANFVLLLKSIAVMSTVTTTAPNALGIHAADGSATLYLFAGQLTANATVLQSLEIHLNGGDSIFIYAGDQTVEYWLSGAVLPYATP